jgi:hypothetical protein
LLEVLDGHLVVVGGFGYVFALSGFNFLKTSPILTSISSSGRFIPHFAPSFAILLRMRSDLVAMFEIFDDYLIVWLFDGLRRDEVTNLKLCKMEIAVFICCEMRRDKTRSSN